MVRDAFGTIPDRMVPFFNQIGECLAKRETKNPEELRRLISYNHARKQVQYVVDMEDILLKLVQVKNPAATLAQIHHAEICASGSADYMRKFAMYCSEVASNQPFRE